MERRDFRFAPLLATVFLVIAILVAGGCAQKSQTPPAQPTPPTTQPAPASAPAPAPTPPPLSDAAKEGAKLYVSYACVSCHGIGGKGGIANPNNAGGDATIPALTGDDFKKDFGKDEDVAKVIKSGSILNKGKATSMPSWNGILTDQQIANLTAYIRAGLPDTGNALPATKTGADVYNAFACVKCHGPVGKGGVANVAATDPDDKQIPALGTAGFHKEFNTKAKIRDVVTGGSVIENGKANVVFMPRWGDVMTGSQTEQVTDWLHNYK